MTPAEKTDRARVTAMHRHRPNDPKTDELAAKFKADRLPQHIRHVVDSAPPLTPEQKDRLAVLLRGAGASSSSHTTAAPRRKRPVQCWTLARSA